MYAVTSLRNYLVFKLNVSMRNETQDIHETLSPWLNRRVGGEGKQEAGEAAMFHRVGGFPIFPIGKCDPSFE